MGLFRANGNKVNWPEVDINKHDQRVELGSTEKQLQLNAQSGKMIPTSLSQTAILNG